MFLWSFCDGFFGFPAIGSSIAGLVPAGVLELIEHFFHLLKLWLAFIAQVGVPL
jgi:hypothetical protein